MSIILRQGGLFNCVTFTYNSNYTVYLCDQAFIKDGNEIYLARTTKAKLDLGSRNEIISNSELNKKTEGIFQDIIEDYGYTLGSLFKYIVVMDKYLTDFCQ